MGGPILWHFSFSSMWPLHIQSHKQNPNIFTPLISTLFVFPFLLLSGRIFSNQVLPVMLERNARCLSYVKKTPLFSSSFCLITLLSRCTGLNASWRREEPGKELERNKQILWGISKYHPSISLGKTAPLQNNTEFSRCSVFTEGRKVSWIGFSKTMISSLKAT